MTRISKANTLKWKIMNIVSNIFKGIYIVKQYQSKLEEILKKILYENYEVNIFFYFLLNKNFQ